MANKLGVVNPDPGISATPQAKPQSTVGVVQVNEVNRPVAAAPVGVIPPEEVIVNVKPTSPAEPVFGVVGNIVTASTPPPPPPKPIGIMEPEAAFPSMHVPQKPKIGALSDAVVTPPAVAANIPEPPASGQPVVFVPNVIDPFEGKGDEEKKKELGTPSGA